MRLARRSRLAACVLLAAILHGVVLWPRHPATRLLPLAGTAVTVRLGSPGHAQGQLVPAPPFDLEPGQRHAPPASDEEDNAQLAHKPAAPASPDGRAPETAPLTPEPPEWLPGAAEGPPDKAARDSYRQILAGWLSRHRNYPLHLRRQGVVGAGVLYLEVRRTGDVAATRMERGTGDARLDELTLAMVQRAGPFPAMPNELSGAAFDCLIDVRYELTPGP